MTIQHRDIAEAELHEPKGVSTALAGETYIANGAGGGAWSSENSSNNTVYVNVIGDFPTPAGGTITLEADTDYVVRDNMTTSDRFIVGKDNSITAMNPHAHTLTYSGTGDMFTGVDENFDITNISLNAATANQMFNFSETGGGNLKIVTVSTIKVLSCPKIGTFDNLSGLDFTKCTFLSVADGITLVGTGWSFFSINRLATFTASATFVGFDFGSATLSDVNIDNYLLIGVSGSEGIKGLAASGNMTAGSIASVSNSTFVPPTTPLNGITIEDNRWEFSNNSGLADSTKAADAYLSTATIVTISDNTFTSIGSTNFLTDTDSRFSVSTAGVITYDSEKDACFVITCTATVEKVGGGTDVIAMRIAKGGTSEAKSQSQTQSADPTSVTSQAILNLSSTDTIEAMVANIDSTANINVLDMNIGISLSG